MRDPYFMLFTNGAICLVLLTLFFSYRFIYPKKTLSFLAILLCLSLLPLVSMLRPGSYESGDMWINAAKSMVLFDALKEGVILPHWAAELNGRLGYPLFLFTYPLPYYIAVLFHLIGFGFVDAIKVFLALMYMVSGIGMYKFVKDELNEFAAFTAAVFYLYSPYHLIDMHFRVAMGELAAFAVIPFCFIFTQKLISAKSPLFSACMLSIAAALLVLSHQAISLFAYPLILGYGILKISKIKGVVQKRHFYLLAALVTGLLLSSFYWLPALFELKYTQQILYSSYLEMPTLAQLLFSPWMYGLLFQGHFGEISFLVGYTQLLVIVLTTVFVAQKKFQGYTMIIFYITTAILLFFFMHSIARPLWYVLPLIKNFQFSWRLLVIETFMISVLAGYLTLNVSRKLMGVILIVTVCYTFLNWGNRGMNIQNTDSYIRSILPESSQIAEGLQPAAPRWTNPHHPWLATRENNHLIIVHGIAIIKQLTRHSTFHTYYVKAHTETQLQENTLFFPGWNILANGKPVPLSIKRSGTHQGVMLFTLQPGTYTVEVLFQDTPVRTAGKIISLISGTLLVVALLITHRDTLRLPPQR